MKKTAIIGSNQMQAITLKGVSKSFGGIHAVTDVDLEVDVGESRALIGPNGAGKTTLYNLITGEIPLDKGEIFLFGHDLTRQPVQKRIQLGMGRTYQMSNLFMELTVQENLFLAAWKRNSVSPSLLATLFRPWKRFTEPWGKALKVAQQVGLEEKFDVPCSELSHGEQRQLELGITLAHEPKILLLDEPMAGLSAKERSFMTQLIMSLKKDMTVVIIEHDIDVAFAIADKVSVLHQGSIIAEGSPQEIQANPLVQEIYTLSRNSNG
jgi:branched-chain amino acid transport system ATP-binding protein